jgi:hypothetical protein
VCFCGAATCQGFIGWRKTSSEEEAEAMGSSNGNISGNGKASAQKRKRAAAAVYRESDCYMCQDDGGELLICDGSLRAGVPCAKVLCRLCTYCESIVNQL